MFPLNMKIRVIEGIIYLIIVMLGFWINIVFGSILALMFILKMYLNKKYIIINFSHQEVHIANTPDSWNLAIYHYKPVNQKYEQPVLLVHGLASSHYFWEIDEKYNFPRYLTDKGYDVWSLDLRGCGTSAHKNAKLAGLKTFSLDDIMEHDVNTAIDYVLKQTGKSKLFWIGHSMGGMIISCHLAKFPETKKKLKGVVILGSPVHFKDFDTLHIAKLAFLRPFIKGWHNLSAKIVIEWLAPVSLRFNFKANRVGVNPDQVSYDTLLRYVYNSTEDIPIKLGFQLLDSIAGDKLQNADGSYIYEEHYDNITSPMLIVAAENDGLAPRKAVEYLYENIKSKDKTWIFLSREEGFSIDYGHGDMIFGFHAPDEVYPKIEDWLRERA